MMLESKILNSSTLFSDADTLSAVEHFSFHESLEVKAFDFCFARKTCSFKEGFEYT